VGVIFVDDAFPEHPKALAAGDAACWLWVCGLAYVRRNNTAGTVPKVSVPRLVTKSGPALAKRLVDAGLWHDDGTVYRFHDYEEFNAKSIAKREQASAAAKARWSRRASDKGADGDADAMRQHYETDASADADASFLQCPKEPRNQGTKERRTNPSSSSNFQPLTDRLDDDGIDQGIRPAAIRILAQRALAARPAHLGPIAVLDAWMTTTEAGLRTKHADELDHIADQGPRFDTAVQLADWLEPGPAPKPLNGHTMTPADGTAAAARALQAEADLPKCEECFRGGRHAVWCSENPDGQAVSA
jgi:hypothetical protein